MIVFNICIYTLINFDFLLAEEQSSCIEKINVSERFTCEHCKKTFAHKSGLNTHLNTHKGIDFHWFNSNINNYLIDS